MRSGTLMIGIAGGTGSGKTTLVRKLGERFGSSVSVVCHDWYYRAQNGLSLEERARQNYDRPEAFETDLLVRDLLRLRNGHAVDCPQYDYTLHNRSQTTVRVEPASVIVVEGILIFADPELRDLFDIRIFVDTDADIRILRRLSRDVKERGPASTRSFASTLRPSSRCTRHMSNRQKNTPMSLSPRAEKTLLRLK